MRYVNFSQLRSFHAVATTGNVTDASKMLNVSQPTVTTQLKQLEERYDVELVYRQHRGVQLSPLGQSLHKLTMRIFALEEEALDLFDGVKSFDRGELVTGAVGPHFIMKLIAAFNREYPNIRISLKTGNSEEVLQHLRAFRIDVAVLGNVKDDPQLSIQPMSRQDVVLVVGRSHRWFGRESVKLEALQDAEVIFREAGSQTRSALEDVLSQRGVTPKIVMEVDREAVCEAAAVGLGIGILSEAEFRSERDLHKVAISDAVVSTQAFLVCLKERGQKRLVRAFMEVAEATYLLGSQ